MYKYYLFMNHLGFLLDIYYIRYITYIFIRQPTMDSAYISHTMTSHFQQSCSIID